MEIKDSVAMVTGGASGLGEATVRNIVSGGGKAVIIDMDGEKGQDLADQLGDGAIFIRTDVTDEASVHSAIDKTVEAFGTPQILVNCAGIGGSKRVVGKEGPYDLASFARVIQVNLIGTFNVIRLVGSKMFSNTPNKENERGVIINTASVAAFEGQIGQAAYSASKGGIVSMTLPIAREFASRGIRVMAIAPGLFDTPMISRWPEDKRKAFEATIPFPSRFGYSEEYALLVESIIRNPMLNGSTIKIDGAIRMQPK